MLNNTPLIYSRLYNMDINNNKEYIEAKLFYKRYIGIGRYLDGDKDFINWWPYHLKNCIGLIAVLNGDCLRLQTELNHLKRELNETTNLYLSAIDSIELSNDK